MPITAIDRGTALIVIDLVKGVVAMAAALAEAFRHNGRPVVLVTVAGVAPGRAEQSRRLADLPADWNDFVPELTPAPRDHIVTKLTWGAFTNTTLDAYLRARDVTQVAVAGVATSAGVESTARQAHELGDNVTLAVDVMTDMNLDAHVNSVTRFFPRLGETGETREIIALLEQTEP